MEAKGEGAPAAPPSLTRMFLAFFWLGLTAFGGPAMVTYIGNTAVGKKKWLDEETFSQGVALCQMVPGATAMQTAAFVGLTLRGIAGAMTTFTAFALPSFIIMMALSEIYGRFHAMPQALSLFSGLKVIIISIVANAAITSGLKYARNWKGILLALLSAFFFGVGASPFLVIAGAALLGLLLFNESHASQRPAVYEKKPFPSRFFVITAVVTVLALCLLCHYHQKLCELALLMMRIDLFAFGGGFASIPFMLSEITGVRGWMDHGTLIDGIALGQVTPGPIIITAVFVGYTIGGPLGGVVAIVSVLLPSFLMVVGIEPFYGRLRDNPLFQKAVTGVLSSFVGLLLSVVMRFALQVHWDWPHALMGAAALAALLLKVDFFRVVIVGIVISLVMF